MAATAPSLQHPTPQPITLSPTQPWKDAHKGTTLAEATAESESNGGAGLRMCPTAQPRSQRRRRRMRQRECHKLRREPLATLEEPTETPIKSTARTTTATARPGPTPPLNCHPRCQRMFAYEETVKNWLDIVQVVPGRMGKASASAIGRRRAGTVL